MVFIHEVVPVTLETLAKLLEVCVEVSAATLHHSIESRKTLKVSRKSPGNVLDICREKNAVIMFSLSLRCCYATDQFL